MMQALLAVIYILSGSFNFLTDLLIFVLWIFFTLGVVGVFVMRRKGLSRRKNYRVPLYPVTPIVGIAGSLYILGSTVLDQPLQSLLGLGVTLLGLPVYYFLKKKN